MINISVPTSQEKVAVFDADGTLYPGIALLPIFEAFEAEGIVSALDQRGVRMGTFGATIFDVENGKYTGGVSAERILSSSNKARIISGIKASGARIIAAYGDTIGDQGLLEGAENGYCIGPSDELRELAAGHDTWTVVDNPDLPMQLVPDLL